MRQAEAGLARSRAAWLVQEVLWAGLQELLRKPRPPKAAQVNLGGGVWTPNFGGISTIFGAFPSLSGSRFPFPAFPPQFWLLFPIPALFSPRKRPNSGSFYPLSSPPQPLAALEEALSLAELRRTTPGLAELMPHPQASPASSVLAPPLFHPTPIQSTSLHLHKPLPFFKPHPLSTALPLPPPLL